MDWRNEVLRAHAGEYARVALTNIDREFPNDVHHLMTGPGDFPHRPRARTPVFYGSFDWHSCVEMHWLLVRLLKVAPEAVPAGEIRERLDRQFTAEGLAAEARFIAHPDERHRQRPYGWGWALALAAELATWADPDGSRWADRIAPLAEAITGNFLDWFPKATYPVRYGVHSNTAFGLSLAWGYADTPAADPRLRAGIAALAERFFARDLDYPGGWEPSGADFLSPALTEAELMAKILPGPDFTNWLDGFLPGIAAGEPASLFTPAIVSDSSDGHIAHLHGLNASRAWCWRRIAEELPAGDPRVGPALVAAKRHAEAALPHVAGDDYMVEHWLACYAVLLLS
ncbi:DUF2891 domain-containing protein [Planosporangium sp. 12N6]|uniref:DUF2891 domain-containing protein n=1 Tax=Planosporangium spinosum TaxID=3402278 RepID=UPI003CED54E2